MGTRGIGTRIGGDSDVDGEYYATVKCKCKSCGQEAVMIVHERNTPHVGLVYDLDGDVHKDEGMYFIHE